MSTTDMQRSNALTQEKWSKLGFVDMYKSTWFGQMFDKGTIFQADELSGAHEGDKVTFSFTGILTSTGIGEGGTMVGNEEALDLQSDNMVVNTFRNAVNNPNSDTIEQHRTNVPFEARARELLPKYMGSRLDASVFNTLAGVNSTTITVDGTVYSGTDRLFVQGLNTPTAPTTNRIVRAGGQATDQALTSSDTMTLDLIDDALVNATNTYPTIEAMDGGMFDLYLAVEQVNDLRRDTTGKIQWYSNELARIQGGSIDGNRIETVNFFSRKLEGEYRGVRIYSCSRVATGQNSSTSAAISTVRRGVMVGRNAVAFGSKFGSIKDGNAPIKFFTQDQDYDYYKGIEARMIYGTSKLVFDSEDYGVHVISTYAA